jgi:hypothetical protein
MQVTAADLPAAIVSIVVEHAAHHRMVGQSEAEQAGPTMISTSSKTGRILPH